ncbi:CHAT domain-containing protein [Actinoalloteichus hymeniacidonis]|uniref:CHAT domain-containing protein n=1 Tax=Actinoalloteichus hymeniacidonis TaxID=340345 RepID=UPI00179D2933|nr:CHAT domain-containing protein [Actinoalloteichus hymeniacidonis]MBB5906049.1 tetratricopeptide (TPR) repeat protein [Actinoalloteichus hymeniacidonis]
MSGIARTQHGVILALFGQHQSAIEKFTSAIALLDQPSSMEAEHRVLLPRCLLNRALAYIALGKPAAARRDLYRCMILSEQDDIPMLAAKATHNLGMLALRINEIPTALQYYEDTHARYRQFIPQLLPKIKMDQGEALLAAGLVEEAAKYLDESLPELRRNRTAHYLAEAEILRASAALVQGDSAMARNLTASAERRLLRRGNLSWAAIAALTRLRADVYVALENGRIGRNLQRRAIELAGRLAELKLVDETAAARSLAVRVALRRNDVELAESELARIPRPRQITPIDHRMLLRLCRAELAVAQGDRRRALAQARAGLAELGRIRDRMGGLDLVSGTAVHGRALGELAIRLVLASDGDRVHAGRLFSWLERTRAQSYRYQPQPPIADPLLAERVTDYRLLSKELQQARLEGRNPGETASRHAALQREITRLGWQSSLWGSPTPIAGLAEVARCLGDRAMVSFAVSDGHAVAVVIVGGRARLVRLGPIPEIMAAARELHADLDALAPDHLPAPLVAVIAGSANRRAERLDEKLLRPLAHLLADRELVIIPTGALYAVAWGALPSIHGRPFTVAPSATAWLAAERPEGTEQPDTDRAANAAAGQGGDDPGRVVLISGPDLLGAAGEVAGLQTHHPDATVLTGRQATVASVLTALDGAGLAHVAAHGAHEPENAMFSRLELTDGSLFAHETARLRRAPERVVLATCELALTRIRPGDEALGFAGALLASGSRTVIAATSKVGDQAAFETMAEFHRLLAQGRPPAAALAEAIAPEPLRRPFVCLGSGN